MFSCYLHGAKLRMQLFPASTPQQHDQNPPVGFETPSSIVYAYAVQSVYPARSRAQKPGTRSSCSRAVAAFTIVWTCSRGHGYCEPGLSRSASKNIDVLSSLARRTWTEERRHLRGSGVYGPPPRGLQNKIFSQVGKLKTTVCRSTYLLSMTNALLGQYPGAPVLFSYL